MGNECHSQGEQKAKWKDIVERERCTQIDGRNLWESDDASMYVYLNALCYSKCSWKPSKGLIQRSDIWVIVLKIACISPSSPLEMENVYYNSMLWHLTGWRWIISFSVLSLSQSSYLIWMPLFFFCPYIWQWISNSFMTFEITIFSSKGHCFSLINVTVDKQQQSLFLWEGDLGIVYCHSPAVTFLLIKTLCSIISNKMALEPHFYFESWLCLLLTRNTNLN